MAAFVPILAMVVILALVFRLAKWSANKKSERRFYPGRGFLRTYVFRKSKPTLTRP